MGYVSKLLIDTLKGLVDGSVEDQRNASATLYKKVFPKGICADSTSIPEILPLIIKLMSSEDPLIQQDVAFYINAIIFTSNNIRSEKDFTKDAIEAGVFPKLLKLLSSNEVKVKHQSIVCLGNIAPHFPLAFFENKAFGPLIECLQFKNDQIVYETAKCIATISKVSSDSTFADAIIKANGTKPLIELLKLNKWTCKEALTSLTSIVTCNSETCQNILDNAVLKVFKKLFTQIPSIKLMAVKFLEHVTSYDAIKVDMVIAENILPIILNHISGKNVVEMKIECIKVIENIIKHKNDFIATLIDKNIISLLCNNLQSKCIKLIPAVLSLLWNIVQKFGNMEIAANKIVVSGGQKILQNLNIHENDEIRNLSNSIYTFISKDLKCIFGEKNVKDVTSKFDDEQQREGKTNSTLKVRFKNVNYRKRKLSTNEPVEFDLSNVKVEYPQIEDYKKFKMDKTNTFEDNNFNERQKYFDRDFFKDVASRCQSFSDQSDDTVPAKIVRKSSPTSHPVIELTFPDRTLSTNNNTDAPCTVPSNEKLNVKNHGSEKTFSIEYTCPSEIFLRKCCKMLSLKFKRKKSFKFFSKIKFETITSVSKPFTHFQTKDTSGFGCFSIFLTGTEKNAEAIQKKIREKAIDDLDESEKLDKKKLKKIMSPSVTSEHLKTITRWLKCRILLYRNGIWQKYGDWSSKDENIPIFVLELKHLNTKYICEIILLFQKN